ncbi:hypothetical protein NIES4103_21360 [Nostoc sp. NIES-4103]|nr:hypothetical protein NIES4103_21360 [Nostoc sp. NIES-4103]
MAEHKRTYNSQIEINDLIDDAVKNAVARRNEALDSEEALLSMSDAEAKSVAGGIAIFKPPIIIGLIAPEPPSLSSLY